MDSHKFPLIAPGDIQDLEGISHTDIVLYANLYGLTQSKGYCWATNDYLAGRLKVSERTLQRSLSALQEMGLIEVKQEENMRRVYLTRGATAMTGGVTPVTGGGDSRDTPPPPLSLYNKKRVINKNAIEEQIGEVYQSYPRKIGKTLGIKKLLKEIKSETDLVDLKKAIENYKQLCISNQTEPQFIKHFSTFAACWRDYLEVEVSSSVKKIDSIVMDLIDGQLVPRHE